MQLVRLTNNFAIFKDGQRVIAKPITPEAQNVMNWHNKNIPANSL